MVDTTFHVPSCFVRQLLHPLYIERARVPTTSWASGRCCSSCCSCWMVAMSAWWCWWRVLTSSSSRVRLRAHSSSLDSSLSETDKVRQKDI